MAITRIRGAGLAPAAAVWGRRAMAATAAMSTSSSSRAQAATTPAAPRRSSKNASTALGHPRQIAVDLPHKRYASTQTPAPSSSSSPPREMYTASFAFFEAIWEAGITHCFVNLGSDHPSIIEAMVKGHREAKGKFPRIITCPNEVRVHPHTTTSSHILGSHRTL